MSSNTITLRSTKADPSALIDTYPSFIAQTVVPEENNFVYVRGIAADPKSQASVDVALGAVTNELILWPQVLNDAKKLGTVNLAYTPPTKIVPEPGVTASASSVSWSPPGQGGRHEALVAFTDDSFGSLPNAANWNDLVQSVGQPSMISLYNASVVDPVFDVYTFNTRLRFFDESGSPVNIELALEPVGIPDGFSVSIYSDNPQITLGKTSLNPNSSVGLRAQVSDGFDAQITVNVYRDPNSTIPPDYSSISLVVSVEEKRGHVSELVVIGAEHIIFDAAIRLARAIVTRKLQLGSSRAQGFYFRDSITDTDILPRSGAASHSPDIQPLGQAPVSNIEAELSASTYSTDISDSKGSVIETGASNFIYLRGAANAAVPSGIEFSLYLIPNSLLITPDLYSQHGIKELDESGNLVLATRQLSIPSAGKYVVDVPFNAVNPPPPSDTPGSDHYCLIAEWREYNSDPYNKPPWPHQDQFPTGADLVQFILGNPAIAWRNVAWTSNPNAPTEIWQVNVAVDNTWSSTDVGQLMIICGNMPVGGMMQFQATAPAGPTALGIGQTAITTPNQTTGVRFTGLQGPWNSTVTVSWWQGGGPSRSFGNSLSMSIEKVIGGASLLAHELGPRARMSKERLNIPLVVGPDYPHLESHGRKLKLGRAHPLPILRTGHHKSHRELFSIHPVTAVSPGGDLRGVGLQ